MDVRTSLAHQRHGDLLAESYITIKYYENFFHFLDYSQCHRYTLKSKVFLPNSGNRATIMFSPHSVMIFGYHIPTLFSQMRWFAFTANWNSSQNWTSPFCFRTLRKQSPDSFLQLHCFPSILLYSLIIHNYLWSQTLLTLLPPLISDIHLEAISYHCHSVPVLNVFGVLVQGLSKIAAPSQQFILSLSPKFPTYLQPLFWLQQEYLTQLVK